MKKELDQLITQSNLSFELTTILYEMWERICFLEKELDKKENKKTLCGWTPVP